MKSNLTSSKRNAEKQRQNSSQLRAYVIVLFTFLLIYFLADSSKQAKPYTCVVVNLRRRDDRWHRLSYGLGISNSGSRLGQWVTRRLDAIDGHNSSAINLPQLVADGRLTQRAYESIMTAKLRGVNGHAMTAGALGCLLSHAKAWERAVATNSTILVLEDDVELLLNFKHGLPMAMRELPPKFGLLYLGDMARDAVTIRKTPYSPHLDRISRPLWGTYAYVVSPLAARRLLMHMYPADVQADSYIKQVAELYEHDMPNFSLTTDAVYTDNSPLRDTDVQEKEMGMFDNDQAASLEYHVLLKPEASPPPQLTFDPSYEGRLPHVRYHTEEHADAFAREHGIRLKPTDPNDLGRHDKRRWLLCLAIAVHYTSASLCFTESFVMLRSIRHLLADVRVGLFMSSASSADDNALLTNVVVYAGPGLGNDGAQNWIGAALDIMLGTIEPRPNNSTTILPAHIFDPLLPLQRPCHCSAIIIAPTASDIVRCQSRCDRMVAPPFAAGYSTSTTSSNTFAAARRGHSAGRVLHASVDLNNRDSMANLKRWKQMLPPGWTVSFLQMSFTHSHPHHLSRFCAGVAAVEKHGGVYVDLQREPRQEALAEVLLKMSDNHAHAQPVVAAWARRQQEEHQHTTADAPPALIHSSSKLLSQRLLAAPDAKHPIIRRLSLACDHLTNVSKLGPDGSGVDKILTIKQLQKVLADDAWSVVFVDERSIFADL